MKNLTVDGQAASVREVIDEVASDVMESKRCSSPTAAASSSDRTRISPNMATLY